MSLVRLVVASLWYHRRIQAAAACGVAVATAVVVGALVVGDSMRASLRRLTLERLGRIDEALVADRFFRAALAETAAATAQSHGAAAPVILLRISVEAAEGPSARRANQVNLIGCDGRFWALGSAGPRHLPGDREIVLNRVLAEQLRVTEGDEVLLRLPRITAIPAESALGRRTDTVLTQRALVREVIGMEGFGRFALEASQREPRNAYVDLGWLQDRLEQPGRANAILAAGTTLAENRGSPAPSAASASPVSVETGEESASATGLAGPPTWRPLPEDYGLRIDQAGQGYINITSDRLLLDPAAEGEIRRALAELGDFRVQPALVYLANTIAFGDREIPYSTIAAVDFSADMPLGPMRDPAGKPIPPLAEGEIALNTWAAEDLKAKPGDRIRVAYFEPESTDGMVRQVWAEFRLAAIVALEGAAADPAFTPEVPGLTDRRSIAAWDPPFPFDAARVRPKDEAYWNRHRGTPKAFVALAAGQRLWGSRFGQVTSLRVAPPPGWTAEKLRERLVLDPAPMGFVFQPVKQQGLAASAGTTDFEFLFLGFSAFLLVSAGMLVALLFRLGVVQRANELGILLALGLTRWQATRVLAAEGLLVAAAGGLLGVALGIGYAALVLWGLHTLWLAAIVTPFVRLAWTPQSLAAGYLVGVGICGMTLVASAWQASRVSCRRLLAGALESEHVYRPAVPHAWTQAAIVCLVLALGLGMAGARLTEKFQAGLFFLAGLLMLGAGMSFFWSRLAAGATGPAVTAGRGNLLRLALRNTARHPGRSTLTVGLVACAVFLLGAISVFRVDVGQASLHYTSGTGGFALVAESDLPVLADLNTDVGRSQLGISPAEARLLRNCRIYSFRVQPGDDASCLNLYRPRQPRVLGVSQALIERGGFAWSALANSAKRSNPWSLLERHLEPDGDGVPRVPAVVDAATATYSLHLGPGIGRAVEIRDGRGQPLRLVVVATLRDSLFQGTMLIGESAFRQYFPQATGFRFFLIEAPEDLVPEVRQVLESHLGDYGLATETAAARLARFLAVQNTYLSTFQSLGGLGLLLGTVGLAVVQLRHVVQRRGELALLRAAGFRRRTLGWLITLENAVLLASGLAVGVVAAGAAVLPHFAAHRAEIPWWTLAALVASVLAAGLAAGAVAVRAAVSAPLLPALRGE